MLQELLRDPFAYLQPRAIIDGLPAEDAGRLVEGAPHAIVEIVAHIGFWQDWFVARCRGEALPLVPAAADGWPPAGPQDWTAVRDRFLHGLDAAVELSDDELRLELPIVPAIEFPPLASYTMRDALAHIAVHNAHHLGQVVLLRQMLGCWPPPSGSWTW